MVGVQGMKGFAVACFPSEYTTRRRFDSGHVHNMNYKRKSGYKNTRSCGSCKPWKRLGNAKGREKEKYLKTIVLARKQVKEGKVYSINEVYKHLGL